MNRLDQLTQHVKELYEAKDSGRADWCDWLYANHVFVVAEQAKRLAESKQANVELAQAAAMLHDIADVKMGRHQEGHEAESLKMARELMQTCGYTQDEIMLTVDDAIKLHSCHGSDRPTSKEGLVLATADALAHLETEFYIYAVWLLAHEETPIADIKAWTLKKIERDFNNKINFDDIKEKARPSYDAIKLLFSR